MRRFFQAIYRWMAISGLIMKDDEPLEVRDPNRAWGPAVDGLQLSAKANGRRLSVVIRNGGSQEIRTNIPDWLFFYQLAITPQPPLSNFGKHALDPRRNKQRNPFVLPPGKDVESEIPIDSLYSLGGATYRFIASCEISGRKLVSNEVTL